MPKEADMSFTTWVRAQDEFGQFDVRKGDDLRDGVTLVTGYPEHIGFSGRPGKPFTDLRVETESYTAKRVPELEQLIEDRNKTAVDAHEVIVVPEDAKKADLIKLLEADDKARDELASIADDAIANADAEQADATTSDAPASGTGEDLTTTDAGTGAGSEN